jgi:phosphoglycolate phosphatase-like HAD superfamily hydrolase
MIRCVLFDLDGTLINTWRLNPEPLRHILGLHFQPTLTNSEIPAKQASAKWIWPVATMRIEAMATLKPGAALVSWSYDSPPPCSWRKIELSQQREVIA